MSVAFRQLGVYVRGAIVLVVAAAIGLVLFKNRGNEVSFWFFGLTGDTEINVVWLILCTAAGTLVTWWALSLGRGIWRDMREVKQVRAIDKAASKLDIRTAELEERERRIDEKLRRAIDENEENSESVPRP